MHGKVTISCILKVITNLRLRYYVLNLM